MTAAACARCDESPREVRSYCRSCWNAMQRLRRLGLPSGTREHRISKPRDGLVREMDDVPKQCLHRFWTKTPCTATATHGTGQWRACEAHRLADDLPLTEIARRRCSA